MTAALAVEPRPFVVSTHSRKRGEYEVAAFADFGSALMFAASRRLRYPLTPTWLRDEDGVDLGRPDGLTDEQHEACEYVLTRPSEAQSVLDAMPDEAAHG